MLPSVGFRDEGAGEGEDRARVVVEVLADGDLVADSRVGVGGEAAIAVRALAPECRFRAMRERTTRSVPEVRAR
jgi:hypothetical protein